MAAKATLKVNNTMFWHFCESSREIDLFLNKLNFITTLHNGPPDHVKWDAILVGEAAFNEGLWFVVYSPALLGRTLDPKNPTDFAQAFCTLLGKNGVFDDASNQLELLNTHLGEHHEKYSAVSINDLHTQWETKRQHKRIAKNCSKIAVTQRNKKM